jgi:hypothetical protein
MIGSVSGGALTKLSYAEGIRALEVQERSIDQLRARTGILLAATSLTASFLGAQTVQHASGLDTLGGLALISLVVSIGLCIYVLLPKEGFVFSLNAKEMYEKLFEFEEDDEEVRRRLVYWLDEYRQDNQKKIDSLGELLFRCGARTLASARFLVVGARRYNVLR